METRTLTSLTSFNAHLDWPGVMQVLRLERVTLRKGVESRTVQYAITSVDRRRASTRDLLHWYRGRWAIENRAFHVRDVTFGEDHSRVRTGRSADVLSRVRNAALNALRALGTRNVAETLREHACRVDRLFARLGIATQ